MDFTDDPFKDYRYEDPFNIEDPFADVPPTGRPTSVAGFETDDFFGGSGLNGGFALPEKRSGRASAPPLALDPFAARSDHRSTKTTAKSTKPTNNNEWAAWPTDWAADAWDKPTDAWPKNTNTNTATAADKTDNWANKSDNWAEWGGDHNKNLNETWPSATLPAKKEKSPKPVKYAKSLVHTIGGLGRSRQRDRKNKGAVAEPRGEQALPSEEQQWAWAAAESQRAERLAEERRRQEDAELQLALAISRQEK